MKHYWLFKSEPTTYSIDDLKRDRKTGWDGIRNYQARNFLRDNVKKGDLVLFYHSSAEPPGVAGVARVVREGYPDDTALDPKSCHFDPTASRQDPRWYSVEIEFVARFDELLPLSKLRETAGLEKMALLTRSRLSVQPVTAEEFNLILKTAGCKDLKPQRTRRTQ